MIVVQGNLKEVLEMYPTRRNIWIKKCWNQITMLVQKILKMDVTLKPEANLLGMVDKQMGGKYI